MQVDALLDLVYIVHKLCRMLARNGRGQEHIAKQAPDRRHTCTCTSTTRPGPCMNKAWLMLQSEKARFDIKKTLFRIIPCFLFPTKSKITTSSDNLQACPHRYRTHHVPFLPNPCIVRQMDVLGTWRVRKGGNFGAKDADRGSEGRGKKNKRHAKQW
jgi:hypothetical protein